jgi:hypothetical protein
MNTRNRQSSRVTVPTTRRPLYTLRRTRNVGGILRESVQIESIRIESIQIESITADYTRGSCQRLLRWRRDWGRAGWLTDWLAVRPVQLSNESVTLKLPGHGRRRRHGQDKDEDVKTVVVITDPLV